MSLFRRRNDGAQGGSGTSVENTARQVMPRDAYCRICRKDSRFTRCWLRADMVRRCTACGHVFENPEAVYRKNQPVCPACGEYVEHQGFEYGLCDTCGSKYEFAQGCVPSLLPNKSQRDEMDRHGKAWSKD